MRVPLSWLKEFVPLDCTGDELAAHLTGLGLEVEQVLRPGGAARGLVVGRVVTASRHPDADELWVCEVDVGEKRLTVVTGADNAQAGTWVVAAPPGSRLPDSTELGTRSLRGIDSEGMLCATWELGWPSVARTEAERMAEGLFLLPVAEGLRPGQDALPLLGLDEEVLVLSLTPNYAVHCQSIFGVAREVAALLELSLHQPGLDGSFGTGAGAGLPVAAGPSGAVAGDQFAVDKARPAERWAAVTVEAPDLCPRYVAHIVTGITVGPSPLLIQRRLQACGMRPINNIVDITNYVLLETGQPLHAFDLDNLADRRIIVRRARPDEKIVTLDGVTRTLTDTELVIADGAAAQAVAGVMGGAGSEVGADTSTILLEAAAFDRETVFRTSRRLGIRTEASIRFDKGVDPAGVWTSGLRAATMITRLAGGALAVGCLDVGAAPEPRAIHMRPARLRRLLRPDRLPRGLPADLVGDPVDGPPAGGTDFDPNGGPEPDLSDPAILTYLLRLGFAATRSGAETYRVKVPSYRADVAGEADLAEEVGRLMGYDRLPALLPVGPLVGGARTTRQQGLLTVRRAMAAVGYDEVVTWSFAHPNLAGRLRLPADHDQHRALAVANPMSEDQARLRTTLLGGLLDTAAYNVRHQNEELALFEVGTVYRPGVAELPVEEPRLGILARGRRRRGYWQGAGKERDFFAVKGVLEHVARRLSAQLTAAPIELPFLQPGQAAQLVHADQPVGWLGSLHPDVADGWDLPGGILVAELSLAPILARGQVVPRYKPLPRFPAVQRDVSIIVPADVAVAQITAIVRATAGELLESIALFDVYTGDQVAAGSRSLAFALRYRSAERTLTDAEVDAVHNGVREALARQAGATLR